MKKITKSLILSVGAMFCMHSAALAADLSGWAVPEYEAANEAGLVSYAVASNNLKDNITREEFCELAVNLYKKLTNETLVEPEVSPFDDTDNVVVSQAYYYGLVSGTSDTTFSPEKLVTRQEMAKMLVNTLTAGGASVTLSDGKDLSALENFKDKKNVSDWAKPAMVTMLSHSLMNGVTETSLEPQGNTTREQAIASVNRSYNTFAQRQAAVFEIPDIIMPGDEELIEGGAFTVAWTPVMDAVNYYVIVKDANSNPVYEAELSEKTEIILDETLIRPAQRYSVVIGATVSTGSEVFSLPVDFTYALAPGETLEQAGVASEEVLSDDAKTILKEAEKYIGVKYVYGGTTPDGFDCSGFVQYVFRNCGIKLNRTSRDQYAGNGTTVSRDKLEPGDLVFFGSGGRVGHVGIYAGNGQMIHSPSTGKTVCYTSIESNYYKSHYIGAKRVLS